MSNSNSPKYAKKYGAWDLWNWTRRMNLLDISNFLHKTLLKGCSRHRREWELYPHAYTLTKSPFLHFSIPESFEEYASFLKRERNGKWRWHGLTLHISARVYIPFTEAYISWHGKGKLEKLCTGLVRWSTRAMKLLFRPVFHNKLLLKLLTHNYISKESGVKLFLQCLCNSFSRLFINFFQL